MRRRRRQLVATGTIVAAALLGPSAEAHDPFQITTDARVHADRIELRITMAQRTATRLCLSPAPAATLSRAELDQRHGELASCGPSLYRLTSGGEPLLPRATEVVVTAENDVQTTLVFPPAERSPLVLDAVHLARLSNSTFGDELTVTGDGTFLGQKLLRADDSALSVDVLVELPTAPSVPWLGRRGPLVISLLVGLVGFYWLIRRARSPRGPTA